MIIYARFSDDNWTSDVACFSEGKIVRIDVANDRFSEGIPPLTADRKHPDWREQYKAQLDWIGVDMEYIPIGLEHDGKRIKCKDVLVAMERLQVLRDAGYNIPQKAFDKLTEEMF